MLACAIKTALLINAIGDITVTVIVIGMLTFVNVCTDDIGSPCWNQGWESPLTNQNGF